MKPLCKLLIVSLLMLGAGGALAHEFQMPASVVADGAGHFAFDVVVIIVGPTDFSSTMTDGRDNTSLGQSWVDGFCMGTWASGTYVTTLEGDLLDPASGGSVTYNHNMCDGWSGTGTTQIIPPAVANEAVAWSSIKAVYR